MNPRGQAIDDYLLNLGLALIAGIGLLAALLRVAGSAAAWLSGAQSPSGGWEAGFRVLGQPGDPATALGAPGLVAWVYWLVLALILALLITCAALIWRKRGVEARRRPRPATPSWRRDRTRRTSLRLREGTHRPRTDVASLA